VVEASAAVDLTIAGMSRAWGIERQTLGRYTDQLAIQCRSSLLITRRYSQVTSHLASVLSGTNSETTIDTDKSELEHEQSFQPQIFDLLCGDRFCSAFV